MRWLSSSSAAPRLAAYPAAILLIAVTVPVTACTGPPSCAQNVDDTYVGSDQQAISLPIAPTALDGGVWGVWIASSSDDALWHVAANGSTSGPYLLDGSPSAIVDSSTCADGNRPWVALSDQGTVVEVDVKNNRVLHSVSVGKDPVALLESDSALWVANAASDSVTRIDMSSASVTATIPVGRDPRSLAFNHDSNIVYVANHGDNSISVIDAQAAIVVNTIQVGKGPVSVAYDSEYPALNPSDNVPAKLWVADDESKTVERIDPITNTVVRTWSLQANPISVLPDLDQAWVLEADNKLIALDDSSEQNLGQPAASVGSHPVAAILQSSGDLLQVWEVIWVASLGTPTISRFGGVLENGCGVDLLTCSG
ncbi:MAG TPA: YncE family protein [Candidatus Acidoferrum sp.]|jgi:YVTN family beta-propeller protein|nr:YncE family protein [Candidatus Acidoferrum sp.]